jgi:hypothetical protein
MTQMAQTSHSHSFETKLLTRKVNGINSVAVVQENKLTPLAGERLRPLGHLSGNALIGAMPLRIKRFFSLSERLLIIGPCGMLQVKPERRENESAQTAHPRHSGFLIRSANHFEEVSPCLIM